MPRVRLALPAIAVAAVLTSAASAVLSSQGQRPPAGNVPRTSAITGVVSDGATGRALAGAIVSFTGTGISLRSVTDSKGRFVFRNLPPADACFLNAEKQGYVPDGIARRAGLFNQTPIALAENEWIADVNFAMWRAGGISGVVIDETGEPVVDVPVRVLAAMPIAGHEYWATGVIARTDDRGRYRIAGLLGGRYIVNLPSVQSTVPPDTSQATIQGQPTNNIVPQGLVPMAGLSRGRAWLVLTGYAVPPTGGSEGYPPLYHPGARTISEATAIDLANSEERRNVDFVMSPVPTVGVSGRVEGPPDVVKGMVVRLAPDDGSAGAGGHDVATALVAADGSFSMVNIPAGRYLLDATTATSELTSLGMPSISRMPVVPGMPAGPGNGMTFLGNSDRTVMVVTRWLPGREAHSATQALVVGAENVSGVELRVQRGASITGRVVREDGAALTAGPYVSIEPADGNPRRMAAVERGSAAGAFTIRVPEPGKYFLRPGPLVKSILVGGVDFVDRPLSIESGADITGVTVTLAADFASLSGNVRRASGETVREVTVVVFPADGTLWTDFGMSPIRIKSSTFFGAGAYKFPRLPAGEYLVVAVESAMRNAWLDPRFFQTAAPSATRVTLEWGRAAARDLVVQRVTLK